jgi:hypothetical protein
MEKFKADFKKVDNETKFKMSGEGLINYVPIQKRGRITIETKEDLLNSARKIIDYLSK